MSNELRTAELFVERIAGWKLRSEMSDDEVLNTDSASELDDLIIEARSITQKENQGDETLRGTHCNDCGALLCQHCGECHNGCFLSADDCNKVNRK